MTQTATAPHPPTSRGDGWRMAARGVGQLLITLGVLILMFVAYELWGTGLYTSQQQNQLEHRIHQQWSNPRAPDIFHVKHVPLGSGIAVLRIPRFGRGYHMVIVEGTGYEDLKKGPGHYPGTALPGQVGNFAVAGHRTTYLAPFNRIDTLRPGDAIVLETKTTWFTYRVENVPPTRGYPHVPYQEIVDPSDVAVAYPVPDQPDPNKRPTLRLLTFTSCNPKYSAAQRIVVHAVLTQTLRKGRDVVPPALEG
ncbi:MAG TPA: class E sortase [Mycobacteriales bacterium]|nr:class E sortase [Mycobacteriales bacterium]